jgi:hypothetical protein
MMNIENMDRVTKTHDRACHPAIAVRLSRPDRRRVDRRQDRQLFAPTVKQHLAAIRHVFDWLMTGQIVPVNSTAAVRGPAHVGEDRQETPMLDAEEARRLLASIDPKFLSCSGLAPPRLDRTDGLFLRRHTAHLKNGGSLEKAAAIANHASTRATR